MDSSYPGSYDVCLPFNHIVVDFCRKGNLHTFSTHSVPLQRGADEGGVAGFLTGTYRGLVGALVRPLASLLETSAKVADSIRNVVMGPPATVPRVRPPRYVSAVDPLARYDWSEVSIPQILIPYPQIVQRVKSQ